MSASACRTGAEFFASVEPWHGNEVVVYNDVGGKWQRRVIFDKVSSGHEIVVVDLNGDGRFDVVANDNSRVTAQRPDATPGVHVFYAPDDPVKGEWKYQRVEDKVGDERLRRRRHQSRQAHRSRLHWRGRCDSLGREPG